MKLILKCLLGILGLIVGIFALMLGVLAGGGVHIPHHWDSYFWFSMLLTFLTPYVLVQLVSYTEVNVEITWRLLKTAFLLDVAFIASMLWEREHLPVVSDLVVMIFLWSFWQIVTLVTYILQVGAQRKNQ